jgi:type IV pilus assembly protein PilB
MEAAAAFKPRRLRIGALLLRAGLLTADQLAEALEEKEQTGERLGEIVVRRGWVSEMQVAEVLASQSDLPFVDLVATPPEPQVETLLSGPVAAYFGAVPVRFLDEGTVLVAVADPTSLAVDDLRSALSRDVRLAIATESAISRTLNALYPELREAAAQHGPFAPPAPEPAADDAPAAPAGVVVGPGQDVRATPGYVALLCSPSPAADGTDSAEAGAPEAPTVLDTIEPLAEVSLLRVAEPLDAAEPEQAPATARVDEPPAVEPGAEEPAGGPEALHPTFAALYARYAPVAADAVDAEPAPESEEATAPETEPLSESAETQALDTAPDQPAAVEPDVSVEAEPFASPSSQPAAQPEPAAAPEPTAAPVRSLFGALFSRPWTPAAGQAAEPHEPVLAEAGPEDGPAPAPEEDFLAPAPSGEAAFPAWDDSEPDAHGEPEAAPARDEPGPEGTPADAPVADAPGAGLAAPESPTPGLESETRVAPPPLPFAAWSPSAGAPLVPLHPAEVPDGTAGAIVPLFEHRRPQLGTILLRGGLVTPEQLAEALAVKEDSGERLGQILLRLGIVGERDIARALAEQHGLEYLDLSGSPPNTAVGALLPEKYARRYRAIPVKYLEGDSLLVAVADPTDVLASDDLRIVLAAPITLAVATASDVEAVIDRVYGTVTDTSAEPETAAGEDSEAEPSGTHRQGPIEVLEGSSAPAIELVNEVLKRAIQEGASDIHFEPQADRTLVRVRIDGVMREVRVYPARLQQAVAARLKIMGELDIAERRAPQDGRVTITFGGRPVDLRIAVLPTLHGEQVVIRVLYRSSQAVDLADLGLAPDTEAAIRHAIEQPYGCLLSVGPTGSGKTTTLYSALGLLNTEDRCVMTIEDPVEYQLAGVNQIQVNVKAGLTFASGLRTILRSDPDVLLVGEIRDSETAKIAVQAAMTGHLVLSTLHADNIGSAVSRLADMGVERQLLASTVNCILAQRLARRLCPSCREPFEVAPELLAEAGADERVLPQHGPVTLYRAQGCAQCLGGYKGRLGLFETLVVTPPMRRLMETATAEEIYETAVADGMRTLQDDGLRLCIAGLTSLEEIKRVAGERRI